jgi:serine/threonine protein kinase
MIIPNHIIHSSVKNFLTTGVSIEYLTNKYSGYLVKHVIVKRNSGNDLREILQEIYIGGLLRSLPFVACAVDYVVTKGRDSFIVSIVIKNVKSSKAPLPQTTKEIINFTVEISTKLRSIHKRGVVYVDLKKANLIPTDDGYVFIDFGASVLTNHVATSCTTDYASLELLERKPLDSRHDIYTLASLVTELITSIPPNHFYKTNKVFARAERLGLYENICSTLTNVLPHNQKFAKLLCSALNPDVRKRPDSTVFCEMLSKIT